MMLIKDLLKYVVYTFYMEMTSRHITIICMLIELIKFDSTAVKQPELLTNSQPAPLLSLVPSECSSF